MLKVYTNKNNDYRAAYIFANNANHARNVYGNASGGIMPDMIELENMDHDDVSIYHATKEGDFHHYIARHNQDMFARWKDNKPSDLKRMIAVMQAFEDGQDVEEFYRNSTAADEKWMDQPNPNWDWQNYNYRVKPLAPGFYWVDIAGFAGRTIGRYSNNGHWYVVGLASPVLTPDAVTVLKPVAPYDE